MSFGKGKEPIEMKEVETEKEKPVYRQGSISIFSNGNLVVSKAYTDKEGERHYTNTFYPNEYGELIGSLQLALQWFRDNWEE